jgi:hypothetical protein
VGAIASWRWTGIRAALGIAAMMVLFIHAARLAMVVFDPYMASRPLADALMKAPAGKLILDDQYYTWSSVIFYTNRTALLLNGRVNNLEYGSNDSEAPQGVFIDDRDFQRLWASPERYYILVEKPSVGRIASLAGAPLRQVAESGGKYLFVNR